MAVGPCDLLVIKFPGDRFRGEIAPAILELARSGTVRIIDILFAIKDEGGVVSVVELGEIDGDGVSDIAAVVEVDGAIGPDDVEDETAALEPNSSVLLILFENTWAAEVAQAVRNAEGEVLDFVRIPAAIVEAAIAVAPADA